HSEVGQGLLADSPAETEGAQPLAIYGSIRRFRHHHTLPLRILSCGRRNSPDHDIARADLAILAAVVTALGVISNILSTRVRVGLAAILGIWCLSSILGNPFTPVSPFTGDLLYGSIV